MRCERINHTLQPTALVNEAYLKLVNQQGVEWQSRTHFFVIAANLLRQILVDHARTKNRKKRGDGAAATNLPLVEAAFTIGTKGIELDLMALNEALEKLFLLDEQQARIVQLRYFGGLSLEETAQVLGLSEAIVSRDWRMAKAWLRIELMRTGKL